LANDFQDLDVRSSDLPPAQEDPPRPHRPSDPPSDPVPVSCRPPSLRGAMRPLWYGSTGSEPPPPSSWGERPASWGAPISVREKDPGDPGGVSSTESGPLSIRSRAQKPSTVPPPSESGPLSMRGRVPQIPPSDPLPSDSGDTGPLSTRGRAPLSSSPRSPRSPSSPSRSNSDPPPSSAGPISVRGKPLEELAPASLRGSMARFVRPTGSNLLARTDKFYEWQQSRRKEGLWPYARVLETPMKARVRLRFDDGQLVEGLNFATQDYLSLSSHPSIHEAALRALRDFGPHAAGSPCLTGNTQLSIQLERSLADFMAAEHVVLFTTGWATGFGTITALVREYDHVVMDALSHASLQQGAMAATKNVTRFNHLDSAALRQQLQAIRAKDTKNGILVISEGLFSMDSDFPMLVELQSICHEHEATLLLDVAHDLGALGPGGTGQIGLQGMLGKIDLVMGCFSKSFGTNGGFLATRSAAVKQFVKYYAGPHTFSTGISPVQTGVALEAIRIVRSEEGDGLRSSLASAIRFIRAEFAARGIRCLGQPSAIVPVFVGSERAARIASALVAERGIMVNLVEYPAVAVGASRFRMQIMAGHSMDQVSLAAGIVTECIKAAHEFQQTQ